MKSLIKRKRFTDPQTSKKRGLAGFIETLFRRFKTLLHIALIAPLYAIGCIFIGLAMVPGLQVFRWVRTETAGWDENLNLWATGSAIVAAVFITAFCMVFILPLVNRLLLFTGPLKPWRGPYYSLEAIRWYVHNGILYVMRYTFLELLTPSPIAILFYQLMGMKIGRGTVINTTAISDPCLLTIGEKVTLGGSATILAHYGQAGFLVLAPVEIGDGATIGLRATIMGGVTIGKNARIMAHSVVLPKTVVPDGETWGGVPAKRIDPGS